MSSLGYADKERMANFFGFDGGYVFTFLSKHNIPYNKTNTRNMIFEACKIDIYNDPEYALSQERCIRKIWDEKDDYSVGCLLKVMLDYYISIANWDWNQKEKQDYLYLRELEKRLCESQVISLPSVDKYDLKMLQKDIEHNLRANTPELVLDRLHTFAARFIIEISKIHSIHVTNDKGENYSLDTMVANLKKYYEKNDYFSSDFCVVAIKSSISLFAKFNDIRNNKSFAHPNPILDKIEAEYVVKIVSETLAFISKIEEQKKQQDEILLDKSSTDELPF